MDDDNDYDLTYLDIQDRTGNISHWYEGLHTMANEGFIRRTKNPLEIFFDGMYNTTKTYNIDIDEQQRYVLELLYDKMPFKMMKNSRLLVFGVYVLDDNGGIDKQKFDYLSKKIVENTEPFEAIDIIRYTTYVKNNINK